MNVTLFWQRLRECKTLRCLQEVLKGERAKREASPQEPPRFIYGAPLELKGWLPSKSMTVGKDFFTTDQYMRTYERADWRCARAGIDMFAARVIEAARRRNVPLYAHTVWRSPHEQNLMVDKGVSRTRPPEAAHVQGYAVDLVHAVHHWELSDHEWFLVGQIGKAVARQMGLPIEWGGDWNADWSRGKRGWDPAHWQIAEWRDLPQLNLDELAARYPHVVRKCPRAVLKMGPRN